MSSALKGSTVALVGDDDTATIRRTLADAGASVEVLTSASEDARWHSSAYAILVVCHAPDTLAERTVQLVREFLLAEKPVAAIGPAVSLLLKSGGVAGRTVAVDADLAPDVTAAGATISRDPVCVDDGMITARAEVEAADFARRVAREAARLIEDRRTDEMSDLSFPASDPPAVSPSTVGRAVRDSGPQAS